MNYPTPMDVAEAEDRAADALDAALDWPYSREVWDRVDAERVELLAANEGLAAELAECTEKRERYALQVCLLLDAMREAGVHIDEKWCWCDPLVESHADSASAVQPERCCLDYPRCDCNSPPEPDNEWHCSQYPGCECFAGCREKALEVPL